MTNLFPLHLHNLALWAFAENLRMKLLSIPLLLLIGLSAFSQSKLSTENILFDIHTDSLYSDALKDYRTIKVYLPEAYSEKKKYPVLYVLDAQWMFEPTVLESKILSGFDVIPPCIVVGIFHKNRNRDIGINWRNGAFTGNSQKFYSFLVSELIPQIDTRYKTSGFNTLVGHSNFATYCHEVIYQKEQPFQRCIENFKENNWFDLQKAKEIRQQLTG